MGVTLFPAEDSVPDNEEIAWVVRSLRLNRSRGGVGHVGGTPPQFDPGVGTGGRYVRHSLEEVGFHRVGRVPRRDPCRQENVEYGGSNTEGWWWRLPGYWPCGCPVEDCDGSSEPPLHLSDPLP